VNGAERFAGVIVSVVVDFLLAGVVTFTAADGVVAGVVDSAAAGAFLRGGMLADEVDSARR
jgi:hypothetical protein